MAPVTINDVETIFVVVKALLTYRFPVTFSDVRPSVPVRTVVAAKTFVVERAFVL